MKLSKLTQAQQKERLIREKFALLAKVGQRKREALAYQEAEEFYFTTATEALALSGELLVVLHEAVGEWSPEWQALVADQTSRYHLLLRNLLSFWPKNSDSQDRLLNLLNSDGLERFLETTPEGYISLSSDQIIENVERIIEATRAELEQKQSS